MLKLEHLTKRFGERAVIDDISYTFMPGKITTIVAPNGTGKTTLLCLIGALMLPDGGRIIYPGKRKNRDVAIVLSGEKNLYNKNTVRENLYYFGALHGMRAGEVKRRIEGYRAYFPMYDRIRDKRVETLSYGQKRLSAIFSTLLFDAHCILLDEASEGLDMEYTGILTRLLKTLAKDRIVLLASHDYDFVSAVSDRLLFLKDGKLVHEYEKTALPDLKKVYRETYGLAMSEAEHESA